MLESRCVELASAVNCLSGGMTLTVNPTRKMSRVEVWEKEKQCIFTCILKKLDLHKKACLREQYMPLVCLLALDLAVLNGVRINKVQGEVQGKGHSEVEAVGHLGDIYGTMVASHNGPLASHLLLLTCT